MKRLCPFFFIVGSLFMSGCMTFGGKRKIKCNVNILGNTVEWEPEVNGDYTPDEETPSVE